MKKFVVITRVLSRKTKNNPVLIGEPGVGKTAIVEGFSTSNCERGCSGQFKKTRLFGNLTWPL